MFVIIRDAERHQLCINKQFKQFLLCLSLEQKIHFVSFILTAFTAKFHCLVSLTPLFDPLRNCEKRARLAFYSTDSRRANQNELNCKYLKRE